MNSTLSPDTLPPVTESAAVALPAAWPRRMQRGVLALFAGTVGLALLGMLLLGAGGATGGISTWAVSLLLLLGSVLLGAALLAWRHSGNPAAVSGASAPGVAAGRAWVGLMVGGWLLAAVSGAWMGAAGGLLVLPMLGALLCLAPASGWRHAGAANGGAVALLAGAGLLAEARGLWTALPDLPWLLPLVLLGALGGVAWLGQLVADLAREQRRLALRQTQRWQAMRRLATDVCWEADASLRIRSLAWRNRHGQLMPLTDDYLGRRPWDMPVLAIDDNTQDLLRACIDSRDRIQDLPVAWRCPDGRRRHYLISGEPDTDADGRFIGYWGVARDVSAERGARQGMQAAARRFQRLFRRLPVAMVMHRDGRIVEANAAAALLLGYERPDLMRERDLLHEHMDDAQRAEAMDRLDELDADPGLELLPVVPRRLLRCDGSPVHALATDLRSEHGGRPALLAVLLDDSAHQDALRAHRRHALLLGRLLALSPAIVALCRLDDGRCVMVSDSLGQVLGLARSAWVGPAAPGPWRQPAEWERLVRLVQAQGVLRDLPMVFADADGQARLLRVTATTVPLEEGACLLVHASPAPADAGTAALPAARSRAGAA